MCTHFQLSLSVKLTNVHNVVCDLSEIVDSTAQQSHCTEWKMSFSVCTFCFTQVGMYERTNDRAGRRANGSKLMSFQLVIIIIIIVIVVGVFVSKMWSLILILCWRICTNRLKCVVHSIRKHGWAHFTFLKDCFWWLAFIWHGKQDMLKYQHSTIHSTLVCRFTAL